MQEASKKEGLYILIAMVIGLIIGLGLYYSGLGHLYIYFKPVGDLFITLLKMVMIPLVFSSIFMAMYHLGTPEALGSMGRKAVIYYFFTTAVAVFIGIVFVNLIQPGVGASLDAAGFGGLSESKRVAVQEAKGLWQTILGVLLSAIPNNPVKSFANGEILQVITFTIILGMVALYLPKESKPIVDFTAALEKMSLFLTHKILKLAPFGVAVLMMGPLAENGPELIFSMAKYMLTVLVGLFCHFLLLLFLASYRSKKSPMFILKGMGVSLITAFSTSSSSATLPVTMTCVEENLGVRRDTAKFVLPLGATVNMDGTALYESVAVIFIAQAYGVHLTLSQQIVIFLTSSLAAVGAAAIPGAGLITMSIVLSQAKLPLDGIGLIVSVDRILDMFRTTVNVFGDAVGTVVVDSLMEDKEFSPEADLSFAENSGQNAS